MRTLDTIEERLAQVIGGAHAGVAAVRAARGPAAASSVPALAAMEAETRHLAERCEAAARGVSDDPVALLRAARGVTRTAATMMSGYLGSAPTAELALEYLCLAKAGEVGRWVLLGAIAESAGRPEVGELARWALPLLRDHLLAARRWTEELTDPAGAAILS